MSQAASSHILARRRAPASRYVGPGLYLLATHNGPKRYWIESSTNPGLSGWLNVRPEGLSRTLWVNGPVDIDPVYIEPMIVARYK
jgi:hypothetical protein